MNLLSVQNLTVCVRDRHPGGAGAPPILQNVSITLKTDKFTCLIGESGAGKTVLSRTLTALLPGNLFIQQGEISYKGQAITYKMLKKQRGRHIFYFPQNAVASLNPVRQIKHQLAEIAPKAREPIPGILKELDIRDPGRILNAYPFQLSGGENQLCLLAMAMVLGPELLILDEPISSLDRQSWEKFIITIKHVQQRFGFTVLLITHNFSVIERTVDYAYIIREGKIITGGLPGDLLKYHSQITLSKGPLNLTIDH